METRLSIRTLEEEDIDDYLKVHHSVYAQFPWPARMVPDDVKGIISDPDKNTFAAFKDSTLVGIGVLEDRPDNHKTSLNGLAFDQAGSDEITSFLRHIVEVAKNLNAISINTWVWDSESDVLSALLALGFKIDVQDSLIVKEVSEVTTSERSGELIISSLADGISFHDFVTANREAFKDDSSRPLEESELENWVSEAKGFQPHLQLSALLDGRIVGTTMSEIFTYASAVADEQHAWIYGLGVIKEFRQKGIAKALVNELSNRLREESVSKLWLFTDTEGPIREFYNRIGFHHSVNWVDLTLHLKEE